MYAQQRSYESHNLTNILLKINESVSHKKNLQQINQRKAQFTCILRKQSPQIRSRPDPIKIHQQKLDDYFYGNRLSEIVKKKPNPEINDGFLRIDHDHQIHSSNKRRATSLKIIKENSNFFDRMNKMKPFISPKEMDTCYKVEHEKMMNKMSKISVIKFPLLDHSLSQPRMNVKFSRNINTGNNNKKKTTERSNTNVDKFLKMHGIQKTQENGNTLYTEIPQ